MHNNHSNAQARRWYVTTAIPYVNARPHIGFAQEIILTDTLARYHRQKGEDVWFLTGTDENSLKNVQAAEQEGIATAALVERNAAYFAALHDALTLSNDDFIRTSVHPQHLPGVQTLWRACAANDAIYKKPYRGLYCVGCEQFYTEDELIEGLCPEHHTKPTLVEEENYFFRLARYQDQLLTLIESDALQIVPPKRKNEVLSFIRTGLSDFSISRSFQRAHGWGIPVPDDPNQVMYVWFDALGNYITALGYGADDAQLYQRFWQENPHRVHVIGKGIIRFHAVYWPAMLLAAGVPLPTQILVHDYVTIEGYKISKSLGNVVDPVALAEQHGTDALRYYLLRAIPSTDDGDFAHERFIHTYNGELADQLGNLVQRVVSMVQRYYDSIVPAPATPAPEDQTIITIASALPARIDAALARFALHEALGAVWDLVIATNKYVEETKPWTLAKRRAHDAEANQRLATALYTMIESLRLIAYYCAFFLPTTAARISRTLGIADRPTGSWEEATTWGQYPSGTTIEPGELLFPKQANKLDSVPHA